MTTLNEVYPLLLPLGITKEHAMKAMPDWWTEEVNQNPNCYLEGCGWLAQKLGLDLRSLLSGTPHYKSL